MGLTYVATFTDRNSPNVIRYTIHGSEDFRQQGRLDHKLMLSKAAQVSWKNVSFSNLLGAKKGHF